jgi:hypothetical protein
MSKILSLGLNDHARRILSLDELEERQRQIGVRPELRAAYRVGRPPMSPEVAAALGMRASMQSWAEVVSAQGAGGTLTAAAEALAVTDVSIPAGYMYAGRLLEIVAAGKASNAVTTPGTLTVRLRWGGIGGVVLVASAALTQNVIVQTDKTWVFRFWLMCLTTGATGTLLTWGTGQRGNQAAAVVADMTPDMFPAASLAAVTVDTTIVKALSFTLQPSLATASITTLGYLVLALN